MCGTHAGCPCWGHLLRPGGLLGTIPTKTPVFPHQFLVSCRSSFRQFFHVLSTVFGSSIFFLKILVLVCTLSIFRRAFIACSHLLWISWAEWDFVGSLFHEMVRSHLIFQIMYMDSETIILTNRCRLRIIYPAFSLSYFFCCRPICMCICHLRGCVTASCGTIDRFLKN